MRPARRCINDARSVIDIGHKGGQARFPEEFDTPEEFATVIGVRFETVWRESREGRGPLYIQIGRGRFLRCATTRELMEQQEVHPPRSRRAS